jgi:predicted negative regulator of RcsB-dependent stress response
LTTSYSKVTKKSGPKPKKPAAKPTSQPAEPTPAPKDPGQQFLEWGARHRRRLFIGTVVVAAVVLGGLSVWAYQNSKERQARTELEQARFAVQTQNFALAASDLARIVATRGGTRAADEASVLLGQVRLQQNEAAVAAGELRQALERGMDPEFVAPAYGLLGAALETIGNGSGAGEAYLEAANASWYDYIAAQFLNDAGRVFWVAGDTLRAATAYERLIRDYPEAPSVTEARVRLAELRPSQPEPQG